MQQFTKDNIGDMSTWQKYTKRSLTPAKRIDGPFEVVSREGTITSQDGYLCIDAHGWPYPVAKDEFEKIYMPMGFKDAKTKG